ncbi:photosystem II protein D1 [Microcoleus sp. FACHB-68]|nr:photosystem II protein D1 [Microcoleus sp. FACHB-68]
MIQKKRIGDVLMYERNAYNFSLDLAAGTSAPVVLTAPSING